jgi:hypothetical protein
LRVIADASRRNVLHAPIEMVARAVEDAAHRLHDLRREEWEAGATAAIAFALALAASALRPSFALPLLIGGLFVAGRAIRACWRRWDLLDRLVVERDAYSLDEVRRRAEQEACMVNRRRLGRAIRWRVEFGANPRIGANADQLAALADELDDPLLALDPNCAVVCTRLLTDPVGSPLNNSALPAEDVRSRVVQIRSGFHRE